MPFPLNFHLRALPFLALSLTFFSANAITFLFKISKSSCTVSAPPSHRYTLAMGVPLFNRHPVLG